MIITISEKIQYINDYIKAPNAAAGSTVDANSNVTTKTVATLEAELFKPEYIAINRQRVKAKLTEMYGAKVAKQYQKDIDSHLIYIHDETSLKPYCASITLYPFLLRGTKELGGCSDAPKNLNSFCGSFVNMVYQVASNFAGAIATVEFLHCFDYFARKQYGKDYLAAHKKEIKQELQGVIYAMNQPACARGSQSVFWNISVFDRDYLYAMFKDFRYPDGNSLDFASVSRLQKFFLEWFLEERKKELLTFPVVTACLLTSKTGFKDRDMKHYLAALNAKGLSFFVYMSDKADSLSSCCRLRNALADNTFSYSLGAGGVVTGSAQVITLNYRRLLAMKENLEDVVVRIHKYLYAHKMIYQGMIDGGLLPAYTADFMNLDKQFLTIGVNGFVEGCEAQGITISDNSYYAAKVREVFGTIARLNKEARTTYHMNFNTELVPAENLGVKNAKWDKRDGIISNRDCYNSYFYKVEDDNTTILDEIILHGKKYTGHLDGGSALHINLASLPTAKVFEDLYDLCRVHNVPYWTTNVLTTICNKCGHIDFVPKKECGKCGSHDVDYATRVIGYLRRVKDFSPARQKEHGKRSYK